MIGITSFRLKDENDDIIQGIGYSLPIITIINYLNINNINFTNN